MIVMYEAHLGVIYQALFLEKNRKSNEEIVNMNTDKLSTITYKSKEDIGMIEYLKLEYRR
ncbi:hypothetical protein PV797_04510 [Clostridiaceae bacterium M8S5]|nr:hypothetical protein PV797_04510 [Clostridiaceae bacterium M8S5]